MKLSIVLATYNRLDQLKRCINSIILETRIDYKIYITDAGSSDGTIEYLKSIASDVVIPIFVGKKLGQAKAYNDVFAIVESPYVCWLSDDNEVVNNGLDRAVAILEKDLSIGMVALKTKDKTGPFSNSPYIGGISSIGILNVNQGVLPISLLNKVGGFCEDLRDYGIDPALTAEVLFADFKIVYTKKIAIYHYRNWSEDPTSDNYKWIKQRHDLAKKFYDSRYQQLNHNLNFFYIQKKWFATTSKKALNFIFSSLTIQKSSLVRTTMNVMLSRYISVLDPLLSFGKDYHLIQKKR